MHPADAARHHLSPGAPADLRDFAVLSALACRGAGVALIPRMAARTRRSDRIRRVTVPGSDLVKAAPDKESVPYPVPRHTTVFRGEGTELGERWQRRHGRAR